MKKVVQKFKRGISIVALLAMLCTLFTGITVSAADETSKEPMYVTARARQDSKGVQVAWKNPTDTTLSKTAVYRIDNFGSEQTSTLVAENSAPTAGAYTSVNDDYTTAYTSSTTVYYKLVCTFTDDSTTSVIVNTDAWNNYQFPNKEFIDSTKWTFTTTNGNSSNYIQQTKADLDYDVYYTDGEGTGSGPSVHFTTTKLGTPKNMFRAYFTSHPGDGSYVKFSYKLKADQFNTGESGNVGMFGQVSVVYKNNTDTATQDWELDRTADTAGAWKTITKVLKITKTTPGINFIVWTTGEAWIDDLSAYVCDASGNVADDAENILVSLDTYATEYYATNSELSAPVVTAESYYEAAGLSWEAVTGATAYNVYEKKADGTLVLRAELPATATAVKLDGLTNDVEYTYVVKAVDKLTKEGTASAETSVTPAMPAIPKSEKEPYNVIATPRLESGAVEVAWKNPTSTALTKTEVYRIDNINSTPTYTLIEKNESPVAGQYAYARDVFDAAYTSSTNVYYKLVCTFADGSSNEVAVYTDAYVETTRADYGLFGFAQGEGIGYSNVRTDGNVAAKKYFNGNNISLDFDNCVGDGPSVKLDMSSSPTYGYKAGDSSYTWNEYGDIQLKYWLGSNYIPKDSYAKISFKIKTDTPDASLIFAQWCGTEIGRYNGTTDWITVSNKVMKNNQSDAYGKFFYFTIRGAGTYWVDDVEVYLCDESGNVTDNTNRVKSADAYFTNSYYTENPVPAAPTVTNTEERDSGVDISWASVADAKGYEVYEKTSDGAYYLRARVPASITTVRMNNLKNNQSYDFVVKTVDATTKGSAYSAVQTLTPVPDPFKVTEYAASKSGSNLTVSADFTNGTYTNGISAQLILAAYHKGEAVSMAVADMGTAVTAELSETKPVSATITLPSDYSADKYTVRAYLWNSADFMKPYIAAQEITVPVE